MRQYNADEKVPICTASHLEARSYRHWIHLVIEPDTAGCHYWTAILRSAMRSHQ